MMFNSSFSSNSRKAKPFKATRIVLLSALLAVVLWLSYKVRHSYDSKHDYYSLNQAKDDGGQAEVYLGRKFLPTATDGSWVDKSSGLREDGGEDDSQIRTEGSEKNSLNKDEGSREGNESKEDVESNQAELMPTDADSNSNDRVGSNREKDAEAKLEESWEEASQKDHGEITYSNDQGSTSKDAAEIQEVSEDESVEVRKEDTLEKENESLERIDGQELGDVIEENKDGDEKGRKRTMDELGHNVEAAEEENQEEIHVPNRNEDDEQDASAPIGIDDPHNEAGELDSQLNRFGEIMHSKQSERPGSDDLDSRTRTRSVEVVTMSTVVDNIENEAMIPDTTEGLSVEHNGSNTSLPEDQQEDSRVVHDEPSKYSEITSESLEDVTGTIINQESSESSNAMEVRQEEMINSENSTEEEVGSKGNPSSKSKEGGTTTTEDMESKIETQVADDLRENADGSNLLMVADNNATSAVEASESQKDGASEIKAAENIQFDDGNSEVNSSEETAPEQANQPNEEAWGEENGGNRTTSSNKSSTEQRKEEF